MSITVPAEKSHPFCAPEMPMNRDEILQEEPQLARALALIGDEELNRLQFKNPDSLTPEQRSLVTAAMLAHQRHRIFSIETLREWELSKGND